MCSWTVTRVGHLVNKFYNVCKEVCVVHNNTSLNISKSTHKKQMRIFVWGRVRKRMRCKRAFIETMSHVASASCIVEDDLELDDPAASTSPPLELQECATRPST